MEAAANRPDSSKESTGEENVNELDNGKQGHKLS